MAGVVDIIKDLDQRVGALESEGLEESAGLSQIHKLYADFEIEATFRTYIHKYHVCGSEYNIWDDLSGETWAELGPTWSDLKSDRPVIRVSPDLML